MGQAASCWCLMMMGWGRGSPSAGKGGDRGGPKGGFHSLTPSCSATYRTRQLDPLADLNMSPAHLCFSSGSAVYAYS